MKLKDFLILNEDGYPIDVNWEFAITVPEIAALEKCEQSPKWHSEGNALIHTKQVVQKMFERLNDFTHPISNHINMKSVSARHACILVGAALFHDLGKATTTEFKKGAWHAYGHEIESEKILRTLLYDEDFRTREILCTLVSLHMEPLLYNISNWAKKIQNAQSRIITIDNEFTIADLFLLKWADTAGSEPLEKGRNDKDLIFLNKMMQYKIYWEDAMINLTQKELIANVKDFIGYQTGKKELHGIVLIGLPGAGKNHWIDNHRQLLFPDKTYKSISRDDIRIKLGFCKPGEKYMGSSQEETAVSKVFDNEVRDAAEKYDIIIFNNINLRSQYRNHYKELLDKDYNVKWIYIYIESDNLNINIARRQEQIPADQFPKMVRKFEWPTPDEYDEIYFYNSGDKI